MLLLKLVHFLKRFYLFIFREGKGGRERGRETSICGCLSRTPPLGTWPATQACALDWELNQVTGQHSVHWATPARAKMGTLLLPLSP